MKFLYQVGWIVVAGLMVSGCAATSGSRKASLPKTASTSQAEAAQIEQTRLTSLEGQIEVLQGRISEMAESQARLQEDLYRLKEQGGPSQRKSAQKQLSNRQIQQALAAAGFYTGQVDGKIGKQTRRAIRSFQQANGLTADGIVGKKTVAALAQYLH